MISIWHLLAWAEIVNVGLILVGVGAYGLVRCFQPGEAVGRLSSTLERQLEEIVQRCWKGESHADPRP